MRAIECSRLTAAKAAAATDERRVSLTARQSCLLHEGNRRRAADAARPAIKTAAVDLGLRISGAEWGLVPWYGASAHCLLLDANRLVRRLHLRRGGGEGHNPTLAVHRRRVAGLGL